MQNLPVMSNLTFSNNPWDLQQNRQKYLFVLAVASLTAVSGLITVMPLGMHFRFALSSIVMMFLLLFFSELPVITTGAAVAVTIFLLRVSVHYYVGLSPNLSLIEIMLDQYPSALYYLFVTIFLKLGKVHSLTFEPLKLLCLVVTADVGSNLLEQVLREGWQVIPLLRFEVLLLVSVIRMGFIVGAIYFRTIKIHYDQERMRFEKIMMIASGLSAETFFLKKSMGDMEDAMAKSYQLHNRLRRLEDKELSSMALDVAQEVHEIKKDSQRIMAGLGKLVDSEDINKSLRFSDIIQLVISSNYNYARVLGKKVCFERKIEPEFKTDKTHLLISILNNLIINAVEAIPNEGVVYISAHKEKEDLIISLRDTGIGIKEGLDLIFEPGFTTKYNAEGRASTGIGLVHVKRIIKQLQGEISFNSKQGKGTLVLVRLPFAILTEGWTDEFRV